MTQVWCLSWEAIAIAALEPMRRFGCVQHIHRSDHHLVNVVGKRCSSCNAGSAIINPTATTVTNDDDASQEAKV
uniref:Uncharacterized protein n=1 Tax=Anopheles dirus TaxID=7168 RepID=A0A182NHQ6_9DIPT